eukprot:CFRG6926T1
MSTVNPLFRFISTIPFCGSIVVSQIHNIVLSLDRPFLPTVPQAQTTNIIQNIIMRTRAAIEENNEESRSPASVLNLPLDCVGIILDLLTQQDILAFRATCRKASSLVATRRNTWHVRRFDNDPRFVVLGHVVCGLRELHLDVYAPSPIQASPPLAIQPYTPVHASSHTHTHMHVLPRGQDSAEVDSNITQEHTRLSTYMHTSIPTHLSTNITMSDDACTCGIDNESGLRNGSANVGTCDNARSTQIRRDRHVHGLTNINLRKRDNMIGNCIGANVNDWAINGLGLYYLPRLLQSLSTLSLSGPMAVVGQYLEMFITHRHSLDLNDDDDDIRAHSDTHSRIYEYCNSNTHDPFPTTTHKSHRRPPCWGSEPPDITLSRSVDSRSLIVDSDYLDLGEVETIFALPAITRLGLVNSQISDRILTIYLPSVGPKLTHLDLAWCGALTEAGLRALTPTATPNLTHLDLSGVATNTETLISLCALPRLQSLKLESCLYITDESAWILSMFPSLSHLSLMMCVRLTDRGIRNLSGSVSLTSVDLSFTHVSHVGVCYLAKNAPCIRTIKLQGCSSIPKAARVHFLNIPSSCKQ